MDIVSILARVASGYAVRAVVIGGAFVLASEVYAFVSASLAPVLEALQ